MKRSDNREIVEDVFERIIVLCEEFGVHSGAGREKGASLGRRLVLDVIVEQMGGLQVHIPSRRTLEVNSRDEAIRRALKEGHSHSEIARRFGISRRNLWRIENRG